MTIFDGDAPPHNHHREIIERLTRELEYYAGLAEESERLRTERDAAIVRERQTFKDAAKITEENGALRAALREAGEAIMEARVYVPEHHGPVNHKIETALSRINELTKDTP